MTDDETSPQITLRVLITSREAGSLIGKEGANVKRVREEANVRVAVSKSVGQVDERILSVTGTPDQIGDAFVIMSQYLSVPMSTAIINQAPHVAVVRLLLPHQLVGSIIGKAGAKIKDIQEKSSARIIISKDMLEQSTERFVDVSGQAETIGDALTLIAEAALIDIHRAVGAILYDPSVKLGNRRRDDNREDRRPRRDDERRDQSEDRSARRERAPRVPKVPREHVDGEVTKTVGIPADFVGAIIGEKGTNINAIRQETNALISISKDTDEHTNERLFTLTGTEQAIQRAITLIYDGMDRQRDDQINDRPQRESRPQREDHQPKQERASREERAPREARVPKAPRVKVEGEVTKSVGIPADFVGAIIGKEGANINAVRKESNALISISKITDEHTNERLFTLTGTEQAIQMAIGLIYDGMDREKENRDRLQQE